jgi:hypothetical protein
MADFTNIDGVYAKDTELRSGIDTLRTTVLSNTIKPLTVTKNGTYTAIPSSGTYGYSPITVDVQDQPWQPLQDGYSNFWFELTNDTLSPWLNFSAKNDDAVIDWGDGSGEVALDTLSPTHTYSKAGKYVVKCKGVTGFARQYNVPYQGNYMRVLTYIETNNELTTFVAYALLYCVGLKGIKISSISSYSTSLFQFCTFLDKAILPSNLSIINGSTFIYCTTLSSFNISSTVETIGNSAFHNCASLRNVTIPQGVTSIGISAFQNCVSLSEIHCLPTTPPTLGSSAFTNIGPGFIIYVPVGTGDTYKSASEWSTYADHILEEGQSLSKSQLRAIAEEQKKSDNGEEMR